MILAPHTLSYPPGYSGSSCVEVAGTARLRPADNRVAERPLSGVSIEVAGRRASATPVIFEKGGTYLLGAVTIE